MEIKLEVIRFGPQDIIATRGIGPYSSMSVNDFTPDVWYLILNGEGAKAYSDWMDPSGHSAYGSDALTLVAFQDGGDWYSDGAPGIASGEPAIANSSVPTHTSLIYIWYGSGYGKGNVNFNTQYQPWSYYLDNNIPLPTSTQ